MTTVSQFADRLRAAFPLSTVTLDPPLDPRAKHFIDVRLGDRLVSIEWSDALGIGVSLIDEPALEGGPDFRLADAESAFRIVKLLLVEAQDASFSRALGDAAVDSAEPMEYLEQLVAQRDHRPPRQKRAA
jgi:hypothetical protein